MTGWVLSDGSNHPIWQISLRTTISVEKLRITCNARIWPFGRRKALNPRISHRRITFGHTLSVWVQKMFSEHSLWNQPIVQGWSQKTVKGEEKTFFWFHRRALWQLIHQHETGLGKSVQNLSTLCILAWQTNFCFHPKQFLSKVPSFYHGRIDFGLVFPIQSTLEQGTFEIRVIQSNLTFFQHVILSKLLPVFTDHHQIHPSARISCHNATRECYNIKILQITKS